MTVELLFVTGNAGKVNEVKHHLQGTNYIIKQLTIEDLPEIQGTPEEVALHKLNSAAAILGDQDAILLTEDTSLCFEALNGLPGAYIKDFLTNLGVENLHRLVTGFNTNKAYAQTIFGVKRPGQPAQLCAGRTLGRIVPARGNHEFCGKGASWDQAFEFDEEHELKGTTYGEMTLDQKNTVSHRSRAVSKVISYLKSLE